MISDCFREDIMVFGEANFIKKYAEACSRFPDLGGGVRVGTPLMPQEKFTHFLARTLQSPTTLDLRAALGTHDNYLPHLFALREAFRYP